MVLGPHEVAVEVKIPLEVYMVLLKYRVKRCFIPLNLGLLTAVRSLGCLKSYHPGQSIRLFIV